MANTTTFTQLLPYQNWAFVEVVKDYHKHLGSDETIEKIELLIDTVTPYRQQYGDTKAALRFMTLAVYMGGILTTDCMHALETVRIHRAKKAEGDKLSRLKGVSPEEFERFLGFKPGEADTMMNDFFGFDIKLSKDMSMNEFAEYYHRCQKNGWRRA